MADQVIHARWIVPVVPAKTFLEHHSIAVKDGKILEILPTEQAKQKYAQTKSLDLSG
jgi:5-methylthioadenosine/S-adenosylhomocysteine deaminase